MGKINQEQELSKSPPSEGAGGGLILFPYKKIT